MSLVVPPKPSPVAPGYRLDRYELLCAVAEGGMASVWVARLRGKHGFEKLVAIKMVLPKFAQDPRFERMFLDEAGIASKIEHANVAQIMDLGEEHDILYLAMEWVDGDALSKIVRAVQRKGLTLPPGVALRVLADACGGLHAAHELRGKDGQTLGVVHRDVSPQNILVSMSGVAKLIDFGIAKARDRVTEDTSGGTMKGKVNYMAPEQAAGAIVDRRADVWAVGATLYYLLAGRPPFEGDNQLATLHLLVSGAPPPPLPSTVHPSIAAIVQRALTHDPEKRFQTAAELQSALESAMADARLVTTTTHVATFVREYMAERSQRRKEAIDLALSAAAERARVSNVLEKAGLASSSGIVEAKENALTLPAGPAQNADGQPTSRRPGSLSEASSATLGSAAVASPVSSFHPPARRSRVWAAWIVAGIVVVGIGAGVVVRKGMVLLPHFGDAADPKAASPGAPTTAAPPPSPSGPLIPPPPALSEMPSASATAPPPVVGKVAPKPAPKSNPTATTPGRRRRIDDGF